MMQRHDRKQTGGAGRDATCAALCMVALLMLAGCETKPGVVFPKLANAPSWPPPPDTPRIFYVGQLVTSEDLRPGVKGLDAVGQAIFGKPDARGMLSPMAVCTDGAERIFVADSNAQCVHVFDLETRRYARWQPGPKEPALSQPVGIAFDRAHQRVLVADSAGGVVAVFAAQVDAKNPKSARRYLGAIGAGELGRPVGVAVDAGGRIYVSDAGKHELVIFHADGTLAQRVGGRGSRPGEFNYPTYVALDRAGRVYVSDSLNFRVQVFGAFADGVKLVRAFGKKGDLPGYFAQPKGIALDSDGHVYVVDAQFENVQLFDEAGRVLMDFGEEGSGYGQFWLPAGIFVDPRDRVYVADVYNKRIQVFDYRRAVEAPPATSPVTTAPATHGATQAATQAATQPGSRP